MSRLVLAAVWRFASPSDTISITAGRRPGVRKGTGRTQSASACKLPRVWCAVAEGETATTATKGTKGEGRHGKRLRPGHQALMAEEFYGHKLVCASPPDSCCGARSAEDAEGGLGPGGLTAQVQFAALQAWY